MRLHSASGFLASKPVLCYPLCPLSYFNPESSASTDDNPWQGYGVQPLKSVIQLLRFQKVILPQLSQIYQPILIVQGRLDPTVHPQSPQIIFDQVSSSIKELHWLEHSTHCVILDKERDLAASLTFDFLKRVVE